MKRTNFAFMKIPESFFELVEPIIPIEEKQDFVNALDKESPTSIRINPNKQFDTQNLNSVPWTKYGYYLPERIKFTFDPLFHAGTYYVQEAGSMLLEQALTQTVNVENELTVLDLCASPGGKSTHLLSLISSKSLLVTNEVISSRVSTLEQNLIKWGYPNQILIQNDPSEIGELEGMFDVIVVDAPCSGEGMFRKHDHAIDEWSLENVSHCQLRQQRILEDIWPSLKENGILIYSTCTYNLEENEKNISSFLEEHEGESIKLKIENSWGIKEFEYEGIYGYHAIPHHTQTEGFFITVIQKKSETSPTPFKIKNATKPIQDDFIKKLLIHPEEFSLFKEHEIISAFPIQYITLLKFFKEKLRVRHYGIPMGMYKGKDFIPEHALALSTIITEEAFEKVEVDLENALKYLQKDNPTVSSTNKGYQLLTFQNQPIGFIKNLGNRVNNLYPKNWRILNKQV